MSKTNKLKNYKSINKVFFKIPYSNFYFLPITNFKFLLHAKQCLKIKKIKKVSTSKFFYYPLLVGLLFL